jgi:hypothetical protein
LIKLIRRVGLAPWPKLWHTLRSTRQTERADSLSAHVDCTWIGNSPATCNERFVEVPDRYYEKAAREQPRSL